MTPVAIPQNLAAEEAVLGAMMLMRDAVEAVLDVLRPEDFYRPEHALVFAAIVALVDHGIPVDPLTLVDELSRQEALHTVGGKAELLRLQASTPLSVNAVHYARLVADCSGRRSLLRASEEITALAQDVTIDLRAATSRAHDFVNLAVMPTGGMPDPNFAEFVDIEVIERWVIPELLQHQERLLVVAREKSGKTSLIRQIAVCVAAGLHPFRPHQYADPRRVQLYDFENPEVLTRRKLKPMVDAVFNGASLHRAVNPDYLVPVCRPQGIDLADRADELWLYERVEANARRVGGLDLLCIGPVYKMDHEADLKNEGARRVMNVLDHLRSRYGCALIMETHAPQESFASKDPLPLRPMGPRKWLAWPEFVRSITESEGHPSCAEFKEVSGVGRDERRWPTLLRRSNPPWLWTEEGYDR